MCWGHVFIYLFNSLTSVNKIICIIITRLKRYIGIIKLLIFFKTNALQCSFLRQKKKHPFNYVLGLSY